MKVVGPKNKDILKMVVKGKSMEPVIMEGSNVIIEKVDPACIRIGNVVVFKLGKKIIIHRIIGIHKINKDLFFLEKGDNLPFIGIFHHNSLIGRICEVEVCEVEDRKAASLYNKNLVNAYLLLTYPLFKSFQIMQRLLSKANKRVGDIVFNFYFAPFRFFLYYIFTLFQKKDITT